MIAPTVQALAQRAGPLIFEFQHTGPKAADFLSALDRFLSKLPTGPRYAIEVRNHTLLTPRYRDLLRAHHITHMYTHWTSMPPLQEQHQRLAKTFTANFVVIRLLTPLGLAHATAVERYALYSRIVKAQPRMRQDALTLVQQAVLEGVMSYVLVNNRVEECSPKTIQALAGGLRHNETGG